MVVKGGYSADGMKGEVVGSIAIFFPLATS